MTIIFFSPCIYICLRRFYVYRIWKRPLNVRIWWNIYQTSFITLFIFFVNKHVVVTSFHYCENGSINRTLEKFIQFSPGSFIQKLTLRLMLRVVTAFCSPFLSQIFHFLNAISTINNGLFVLRSFLQNSFSVVLLFRMVQKKIFSSFICNFYCSFDCRYYSQNPRPT